MEGLVDLLPLLFIGLYYLLSSRRKARAKQAARTRTEAPQSELIASEPDAATPFRSFLEQLEAAMAESVEGTRSDADEAPAVPEVEPVPAPRLERLPSPDFQPVAGSFDSTAAVDHERHGFGRENPLSEEVFERLPVFTSRRRRPEKTYDPHGLRATPEIPPTTRDWRRRLRHPEAARDAFVLQTIFGQRGGVHGGLGRRDR